MTFAEVLRDISKYFDECTDLSSIHGVKFVGNRKRSIFERLLWLVIWLASVTICSKYVLQTYEKWQNSPVFVTIGTGQVPIHDVSFPAITICPEVRTDSDVFSYQERLGMAFSDEVNLTDTEMLQFEYMAMICNRSDDDIQEDMHREYFDADILNFFHNITPSFNETFKKCRFSNIDADCEEIFTPIFTKEGICYSFNILDHKEMFREDIQQFLDYNQASNSVCFNEPYTRACKDVYPRRASFSGVEAGLEVELGARAKNLDFKCASALQGYKVIMHDPSELPTQNHNHFRLPLDQAVFAAVTPEVIVTKKDLESYPANLRKCYFDDEKILKHFRFYSQQNCEIECLMYLMSASLDCVDFYLPLSNSSNSTEAICSVGILHYVRLIEKLLVSYISNTDDLNLSLEQVMIKDLMKQYKIANDTKNYCDCLPSCTSVEYAFETTQTDYHWRQFTAKDNIEEFRSLMNIYFKQSQYIPMQREEMFGSMDFIAYCGGLLGLFIGFSFISLIEIVYFLTLRIGCNVRMYGRKLWHGSDN